VKRRVLTVALALLLAVVGTGGVLAYVRQANNRALAGQKAVSVLVAGKLIPSGTTVAAAFRDGLLTSQKLPAAALPSDAMSSIPPSMSGLVLSADVQQGQLLLRPMLVTAAEVTSGLPIPAGMVAVTVNLCLPEAVAGYVRAGSEVEVFSTYGPKATSLTATSNCTPPHGQQDYGDVQTRVVLPRLHVLSVGPAAASTSGSSATSGSSMSGSSTSGSSAASSADTLVTVAVSQANAGRLILLAETGLPYLALLTGSAQTSVDTKYVPPSGPPSGQRPSARRPSARRPSGNGLPATSPSATPPPATP
jgi:pilus assembly protein CpaB